MRTIQTRGAILMRIPNIIFSVGTAALLFTASAGMAFAKDEGRYVPSHDASDTTDGGNAYNRTIWITDTKTGRTKWCTVTGPFTKPMCSYWSKPDD